jgi:AcrR family transcriptional regulator
MNLSADLTVILRKSDRTREAILDAARIAFARKGFSGVTIRDITDLAGVTRANFYYYFRDKTELFIGLGTETYREALETVEALGEIPDGDDSSDTAAIRYWVVRYLDYLDRNGAFVVRSEDDSPKDPKFRAAVARSYEHTAVALGQRIVAMSGSSLRADPAALGLTVMAMLERSWSMIQHYDVPSASRDSVIQALTELIERMVS